MEDGDVIDAHLQQARAHLISYCLRSSRLFSSEVAHAFTHDLFMPGRRVIISICLSNVVFHRIFMCCTYHISQDTLVLNLVLESEILEKTKQYCICTSPPTTHPYVIRLA